MPILSLQVESENADLKLQVVLVTKERDSVIQTNQGLQTKLENLEQVLKVSRLEGLSRCLVLFLDGRGCLFAFFFFCLFFRFGASAGGSAMQDPVTWPSEGSRGTWERLLQGFGWKGNIRWSSLIF